MLQKIIRNNEALILLAFAVCLLILVGFPATQSANAGQGQCPNCGMILKMYAHTNHEFSNTDGKFTTCSIHCVADMSVKSGSEPQNVRTALHLDPEMMVPAETATYVIGSKDPGTMTMVSKLAFKSRSEAEKFVAEKGGKIASFSDTYDAAIAELPKAKPMIQAKRIKMGSIVEPSDSDRCVVCNMLPAKYPKFNAQLVTTDKKRYHLCSNQCLSELLEKPQEYGAGDAKAFAIWVHDHASGRYIYGENAYYVLGSKVLGPMGYEAIAFDLKSDAADFSKENGGTVVKFDQVTMGKIKTK